MTLDDLDGPGEKPAVRVCPPAVCLEDFEFEDDDEFMEKPVVVNELARLLTATGKPVAVAIANKLRDGEMSAKKAKAKARKFNLL
jgi:hypothetical protein